MPEGKVRARVMVVPDSSPGGSADTWKEAELSIEGGLRIRYLKDGLFSGEDFFSFSSVVDLGFKVPSHIGTGDVFAVRFQGKTLFMAPGSNPLIYSPSKFRDFIHGIFEALLRGRPVLFWEGGEVPVWERGYLGAVGVGKLLIIGPNRAPILSFPSVVKARTETVDGKIAWFLERYTPLGISGVYLHIPERKTRLFVLRYLSRFGGAGYLPELAREFPDVLADLKVPDVSPEEREVLMALMSGIDPLELPGLLRMDVRRVEEIYDRLIRKGLLSLVGIRKIVEPTPLAETAVELEEGEGE
ncbi:hypothetical protein A3L09_04525 [Thermococcus profundus]|uniref:Uncharacterized protein n=1 Tax=Thermococcus profundus TaxID=49899 RepID=A0A2Z2MF92_THEPR|nr:hypothetical protein [Thermococcus profundus]ASJ02574.1 hypothetical protein A3L09_04525 [Thermococcus profundus]